MPHTTDHSRFSTSTARSHPGSTLGSITTSLASLTSPAASPSTSPSLNSSPRSLTRLERYNLDLAGRHARHAAGIATLVAAGWSRQDAAYALSLFKDNPVAAEAFLFRRDPNADKWDQLVVEIEEEFEIDMDDPGKPRVGPVRDRPESRWRSTVFGAKTLYDFYTMRYLVRAGWSADIVGGSADIVGGQPAPPEQPEYHYKRWSAVNQDVYEARAL